MNMPVDGPSSPPRNASGGGGLGQGVEPSADQAAAHEIGNLLQVVNGYLELLAARTDDTIPSGYIDNAQLASRALTEAIKKLGGCAAG